MRPAPSRFLAGLLIALLASGCASAPPAPLTPPATPAESAPASSPSQDVPIDAAPTQTGQPAQGSHRVIVTLKVPFKPEGDLSPEAVQAQRAAIARAGDDLLASLSGQNVTVAARFEAVPQLVLIVDDAALSALTNSPLVAHVQPDEPAPPDSLP